jgi:FtsP/CotA-like multicopper oxidase with cupredoxin domain
MTPTTIEKPEATAVLSDAQVASAQRDAAWRQWISIGIGLTALLAVLAIAAAVVAMSSGTSGENTTTVVRRTTAAPAAGTAAAPTLAQSKGVSFEPFEWVDPTLPAVPAGAVKRVTVDVDEHVVQVSKDLAPTRAWTYTVNGKVYKGTAASPPIVVNEGDRVAITFVNGGSKAMNVTMAHSVDFHSAEVAPNKYYVDIAPGKRETIRFTAKHAGVFMYHCATQPVLMHVGNGMSGMMVVKPRGMAKVDRELWVTQGEYYLGKPGAPADMDKLNAEKPDVIAFNGYANQYKTKPIEVRKGEKIRMFVLNAGPSKWSAFHVIGTVFDKAVVENTAFRDSQTMNLAPSQGGWAEFTLDQQGNFPFVTHAFGDMVRGAAGMLRTEDAPKAAEGAAAAPAATTTTSSAAMPGAVKVTLGDMWIKADRTSVKAGEVMFDVANAGAAMHGLAIVAAPAKVSGGMVDEKTFIAKGADLAGGKGGDMITAKLKPGKYELVCHMAGHYAAGQHIPFTVTD